MKLAFNGQGRYTDFSKGFALYKRKAKDESYVDERLYKRVVRAYCSLLAKMFLENGMVDLPCKLGTLVAASIKRKPQYRGKQFLGYGKMDWNTLQYDGKLKAFGLVFLPNRQKNQNLRCFGYVANRRLFKKMKEQFENERPWDLMDFNDDMI